MNELLEFIDDFRKKRNWDQWDTPSILAKSIVIEAAELLEHFQWNEQQFDEQQVESELADVLAYALAMCIHLKLDPSEIIKNKFNNDVAKRYPEKNG